LGTAEAGETGIDAFDAWARELRETGYLQQSRPDVDRLDLDLHPAPALGGRGRLVPAHLLDGDPASNTLSWRWVAGLQTRGKAYVARASNIARYTDGRFDPKGLLNETPMPLAGPAPPARRAPPEGANPRRGCARHCC
jgi:deoxyribodipyrimidine photo-lyase